MKMPLNYSDISAYAGKISSDLQRIRRYLHANPELGRMEYKTSAFLQDELKKSGEYEIDMVGETGFCSDLLVDTQSPWVAMRGDIDALPVPDKKEVPYRSTVPNICHACGHDFHATVTLGVARLLHNFKKYLKGNVRFIFQHAEEPTPGGAIDFVKAGKLDSIKAIFGLHADSTIDVGILRIVPGWITAQSIHISIEITGEGGHSARPYETSDPVFLGTQILNELYSSLYRFQKEESPFVFTIGMVSGGTSYNSISNCFRAEGTLRVTDSEQGDQLLMFIDTTVKDICSRWGGKGNFKFIKGAQPLINDPVLTSMAKKTIAEIIDKNRILDEGRSLGGEDFSEFLCKTSGLFIKVGVGNKKNALLHSSYFDVDEKAIPFAVSVFSWIIIHYLNNLNKGKVLHSPIDIDMNK
jgi:amidohydrolase